MPTVDCRVLLRPESAELRYLPEGPYDCGGGRLSWVSIQHGVTATTGALNVFDMDTRANFSYPLEARPGFAFPTNREGVFAVGLERRLGLFDTATRHFEPLCDDDVDREVEGTIINDGVVFDEGLVFGTKDLKFEQPKAGLSLWRLFRLRDGQVCSNGKVIRSSAAGFTLLDIDTPTRQVVAYELDVGVGRLGPPRVVLDLRHQPLYPDGMIETPEGDGLIVALFNPHDAEFGVACQFDFEGRRLSEWRTPGSPQVTCPVLVTTSEGVQLVLTTAAENMSDERLACHANAGCLFLGPTEFARATDCPRLNLD